MPPYIPRKRARAASPDAEATNTPASKKSKKTPSSSSTRKPTLFDALDAPSQSRKPSGKTKAILDKLANEDDSDLSSLESTPEFDDVPIGGKNAEQDEDDEDEDIEFEDVQSRHTEFPSTSAAPPPSGDLDLTLREDTRISITNPHGDKKGPSKIERKIRIDSHCMHVQCLMWHNAVRNSWLCDPEVQALLLSHLPAKQWAQIEKWRARGIPGGEENVAVDTSKGKGKGKAKAGKPTKKGNNRDWSAAAERQEEGVVDMSRGDPLFKLMDDLIKWWKGRFQINAPGIRKIGYMSLERLDKEIKSFRESDPLPDSEYDPELHGERIRNIQEFKARAQYLNGSRDVGAQLFTALLRGLGLEARMVASLQPVGFGWSKVEEAVERKEKKAKDTEINHNEDNADDSDDGTEDDEEVPVKKAPKSRKTKVVEKSKGRGKNSTPISLDSEDSESDDDDSIIEVAAGSRTESKNFDKDLSFPHYWTEVLSPATKKYVAVDPIVLGKVATNAELLALFEPRGAKADKAKQVLAYVVGHSADGTAKDVTVRYLKRHMWPGRTKGMRMNVEKIPIYGRNGKVHRYVEQDWFLMVMSSYARGSKKCPLTEIDEDEDSTDLKAVKPEKKEVKEGEETLQSYKTSEKYVLERHLRREEALLPTAKHVKMFTVKGKGGNSTEEKVFLRKDVVSCKSMETWHKEGREPKPGEEPRKRVPYRAATTNRKRELAEAEAAAGGTKPLQGLYSIDQTDYIIPPPIKDGIIPKNQYGNIDCYVPSMVPQGAVHLPLRGTVRVCKKLGINFAEAVVGFEFGARMAVPIVSGVVIAEENEEMVMEQWHVEEAERVRKEDEKRQKLALGMWRKFLMGLRIIERVREEYGDEADDNTDVLNPWTNKNTRDKGKGKNNENVEEETQRRLVEQREEEMAGGFFPEGMDVEEPSNANRPNHGEEGGGGFFPINAEDEDDDDDGGGGFIVENADDSQQPAGLAYPTPASLKQKPNKPPSKAKGRKVAVEDEEDEAGGTSSSLSDVEMNSASDVPKKKSAQPKRPRAKPKATPRTRAAPKRGAAKKSEKAVKSHYFENSDDEMDDEE